MLGLVGGTGVHELTDAENLPESNANPPKWLWGVPSSVPTRNGDVWFLNRHGPGHRLCPHEVNYRANIGALKQCGVEVIVGFCAVGSLRRDWTPGTFVLVDQYVDRTAGRTKTFFQDHGVNASVSLADPVCSKMNDIVLNAAESVVDLKRDGWLACIDGPQFSTRAESKVYQSWGCNLVGMTTATEARLAREAGICYVNIAMVTDHDCGVEGVEKPVTSDQVVSMMKSNCEIARKLWKRIVEIFEEKFKGGCSCRNALENSICSDIQDLKSEVREKYSILNPEVFRVL